MALGAIYKFNPSAQTTDSSGNGNTLTVRSTVLESPGRIGTGADFGTTVAGTNALHRADSSGVSVASGCTWYCWCRLNANFTQAQGYGYGLTIASTATTARFLSFYFDVPSLGNYEVVYVAGNAVAVTYPFTPAVGQWFQLAMSTDTNCYCNGTIVKTRTIGNYNNGTKTIVGNASATQSFSLPFTFDEVRFEKAVLSPSLIKTLYASHCGIF